MYKLTAYLSGTEDSTTDYPLALASFGLNKRTAAPSFYSATVPFSDAVIQAFVDRPNGKVHIQRDGAAWEWFNVAHPVRYDIGPNSATISLSGTRQETNNSPATLAIEPRMVAQDGINSDGLLTLDLVPGLIDPRPGDTITWDGSSYTVVLLKFQAGATSQTLSINAQVQP